MFESLSHRLTGVLGNLKKRGILTEEDVNTAMREVRIALLEADVALPVVKDFIAGVKEKSHRCGSRQKRRTRTNGDQNRPGSPG